MKVGTSAMEVVDYLAWLAEIELGDDDAALLTNLMVQKHLYFQQGWHLAEFGVPLFEEQIEAWEHGPVVPEVYHKLKKFGKAAIPVPKEFTTLLTPHQIEHIKGVWDRYKGLSAYGLVDLTHKEQPWLSRQGKVVRLEAIKAEFERKMEEAERRLDMNAGKLLKLATQNTLRIVGREAI